MAFIRFNGELIVYSSIILLGGMVLTALTFALFKLIDVDIDKWYMSNVVVWGLVSSPIVATFLINDVVPSRFRAAALLAKVFSPLFLITVVVYLLAMVAQQKSPYSDREFLITFNGLLLLVLAIAVFSLSENRKSNYSVVFGLISIALIVTTLIIDMIALSAIVYRLSTLGITPNRIAVLGANLLIFIHLVGILKGYFDVFKKRGRYEDIEHWIAQYMPIYTLWSSVIVFGLPLFFGFE